MTLRAIDKMLAPLKRRVLNMIARAVVAAIDDGKKIQQLKMTVLADEELNKIERVQNYGFTSHPKKGAEAVVIFVGGNRDHGLVIACDDQRYRLTGLAEGEVALYDDLGSKIVLKRGGNIEVTAPTKIKATAPNVEVIASVKVLVTTPLAEFSGNVKVGGNLEVIGTTLLTGITTAVANIIAQANVFATALVGAAGFTGPGGSGAVTSTENITTTANVSGGGTDLASVKSTFNTHKHTGVTTGIGTSGNPDATL